MSTAQSSPQAVGVLGCHHSDDLGYFVQSRAEQLQTQCLRLTILLQELAEEGRQLGRHMFAGDGVGQLNARRLLWLAAAIEHGQGQTSALLQHTRYALWGSRQRLVESKSKRIYSHTKTYPWTNKGCKDFNPCAMYVQQLSHVEV